MNNLTNGAMPAANADGALAGAGPMAGAGPQVDAGAMQTPPAAPSGIDIKEVYDVIHKQSVVDRKFHQILDEGGPVSRKKIIQAATEIVAERVMSAQAIAQVLSDLPEDPDAIREWLTEHAKTIEDQLQQLLQLIHGAEDPSHPMDAFGNQPHNGPSQPIPTAQVQ